MALKGPAEGPWHSSRQSVLPALLRALHRGLREYKAGAGLLIIDSVGVACGGDLNAPAVANTFAGILRSLSTTVLLIHHTSKDKTEKGKTPFGSAYFTTNARSVWEVRKVQDVGDSEINVGLFHRKSNNTRLHSPIGLRMKFGNDSTEIRPESIESNFSDQLSDTAQIIEILKSGKMTTTQIADGLGMAQNKVRALTSRLKGRGRLVRIADKYWGLAM